MIRDPREIALTMGSPEVGEGLFNSTTNVLGDHTAHLTKTAKDSQGSQGEYFGATNQSLQNMTIKESLSKKMETHYSKDFAAGTTHQTSPGTKMSKKKTLENNEDTVLIDDNSSNGSKKQGR